MSALRCTARAICRGVFFFSTVVFTGIATAVSWTYLDGPFGGEPFALANDAAGNTWAGMNGSGVFFRAAGATQWVTRPGLPTQSNYVFTFDRAGTAYISGTSGVYALAAGGTTWQRVSGSNGLPDQAGGGLTTDALGAVYAGMNRTGAVYKLDPGGTAWTAVGAGLLAQAQVNRLVFDGAGNLWALIYGAGVFRLAAGGATWSAMNSGLDIASVQALAVVGSDLFAGNQNHGAYKLANASGGGSTWAPWNGGSLSAGASIFDFARGAGNALYAAGNGVVHALASGATTWSTLGTGLSRYAGAYSIAYSSADGALTLGNGSGVLRLPAGATAWQLANDGLAASSINGLAVAGNGDLYAATSAQGVQRLANGGATWTAVDPANTPRGIQLLAIDGAGIVYACGGGCPDVLRLAGGTWSPAGTGQDGFADSLAVDAANALWIGQTGVVSRLPSGASAWARVGSGLPSGERALALAFDGSATAYAALDSGVYSLAAGAATWTLNNTGLPIRFNNVLQRDRDGRMLAAVQGSVYKLAAGTWQLLGTGLEGESSAINALALDGDGNLYAGFENSYVWRLAAGSTIWSQLKNGLSSRWVQALAAGGGRLYAGTVGLGGAPSGVFVFVPLDSVVEFYNNLLDNYFITATAVEQAAVDNGAAGPGWSRTGDYFNAGGPSQVCRFYGSQSPGPNSHFYTIDPAECQALKDLQASTPSTQKRWNFESNDFASRAPVGGQCASGLVPVYRAYNDGFTRGIDSNHRITANHAAYLAQVATGWRGEGVVMCAPAK